MNLPAVPSLLAACLVLMVGDLLAKRVPLLARFSIPAPIVGGVLFALGAVLVGRLGGGGAVTFDSSAKSTFLLLFFASVGLTADLALLRKGSRRLLRFLAALFPFLVAQNALGLLMAFVLGLHPVLGLVAGSITLVGGHGTGAAYAERFAQDFGLLNVMGLTMTSATLGLVIGGVVGGPVAERLMRRFGLKGTAAGDDAGDVVVGPQRTPITTSSFIGALAAGLAAVVAGQAIATALEGAPITVPSFLWCLLAGLVLRNGGAALGLRLHDASADLLGSACLSLFLVWTMMTLDLVGVATVAGPLVLILAAQTVLVVAWSRFVVFRLAGRDYEAVVTSAAFCGFAMGATATAIANMQALTRRHGSAPESAVVVPLVGAFFVDLMNLAVLTFFLLPGFIVSR